MSNLQTIQNQQSAQVTKQSFFSQIANQNRQQTNESQEFEPYNSIYNQLETNNFDNARQDFSIRNGSKNYYNTIVQNNNKKSQYGDELRKVSLYREYNNGNQSCVYGQNISLQPSLVQKKQKKTKKQIITYVTNDRDSDIALIGNSQYPHLNQLENSILDQIGFLHQTELENQDFYNELLEQYKNAENNNNNSGIQQKMFKLKPITNDSGCNLVNRQSQADVIQDQGRKRSKIQDQFFSQTRIKFKNSLFTNAASKITLQQTEKNKKDFYKKYCCQSHEMNNQNSITQTTESNQNPDSDSAHQSVSTNALSKHNKNNNSNFRKSANQTAGFYKIFKDKEKEFQSQSKFTFQILHQSPSRNLREKNKQQRPISKSISKVQNDFGFIRSKSPNCSPQKSTIPQRQSLAQRSESLQQQLSRNAQVNQEEIKKRKTFLNDSNLFNKYKCYQIVRHRANRLLLRQGVIFRRGSKQIDQYYPYKVIQGQNDQCILKELTPQEEYKIITLSCKPSHLQKPYVNAYCNNNLSKQSKFTNINDLSYEQLYKQTNLQEGAGDLSSII